MRLKRSKAQKYQVTRVRQETAPGVHLYLVELLKYDPDYDYRFEIYSEHSGGRYLICGFKQLEDAKKCFADEVKTRSFNNVTVDQKLAIETFKKTIQKLEKSTGIHGASKFYADVCGLSVPENVSMASLASYLPELQFANTVYLLKQSEEKIHA